MVVTGPILKQNRPDCLKAKLTSLASVKSSTNTCENLQCCKNHKVVAEQMSAIIERAPSQLTYVFGAHGHRSAQLCDKLLGIQSDLDDVVEQSEEWGEWERGHKQGHKPELDDWHKKKTKKQQNQKNVQLVLAGSTQPQRACFHLVLTDISSGY